MAQSWQRRLRPLLAVFVIAFAVVVYFAMRPDAPVPKKPTQTSIDPRAQSEVNRGTVVRWKGKDVDFTLNYQNVLEYASGQRKFRGVRAQVKGPEGQDVEITGAEASVSPDQSSFVVSGDVRLATADGLVMTTQEASYSQAEATMRAPGQVAFTRGSIHGTSLGMTYDEQHEVVSLLGSVAMTEQQNQDVQPSTLQAGFARWLRNEGRIDLEQGAKIVRAGQTLQAETAVVHLAGKENRLQSLELHGGAKIEPAEDSPAATSNSKLRAMHARDITLLYGPEGDKLRQVLLAGKGSVEIARPKSAGGATRIAGESIDIGVDASGTTVRSLDVRAGNATERAELLIPAEKNAPSRLVRSSQIHGPTPGSAAPSDSELSTLRFTDNVEYREIAGTDVAKQRTVYARVLDLSLAPGMETVEEAHFTGDVNFREGETRQATSRDARYAMTTGEIELTGAGPNGEPPQIVDERASIQAHRIVTGSESSKIHAEGSVRATFKPRAREQEGNRTPVILSGDKPVFATSDQLDYTDDPGQATFTSSNRAQVWQPDRSTTVFAKTIRIDDKSGNVWADGSVLTRMLVDEKDTKSKQKGKAPSEATSDHMFYEDARRTITYTDVVHIRAPEGDLTTDKAVIYLSSDGSTVERTEAFGHVSLQTTGPPETGKRTATGDTLTYIASDERYTMNGDVVKYSDECYETQAKSLTFFRSVGRIVVDGNEERRTQTKGGLGCKAGSPTPRVGTTLKEPRSD